MSIRDQIGMGCGVAGVGLMVISGALALGGLLICAGMGTNLRQSLPDVVEVEPSVPIPPTPSAPDLGGMPEDPAPFDLTPPDPLPRPSPSPSPTVPDDPEPDPVPDPEPEPDAGADADDATETEAATARVSLIGDAQGVVAVGSDGSVTPLPAMLPRGAYSLRVTFPGQDPFDVGSLAVHDGTERVVTCRASLGICKVSAP